ncbi:MAG: gspE [Aeromicrobium sp.]|nr:gspE [Aeromicrobium sp.]
MTSWDPDLGLSELPTAEAVRVVRLVADRLARRLAEEIEARRLADDDADPGVPLERDILGQELLIGEWIAEELGSVSQARMQRGSSRLSDATDGELRRRVVAELFAFGPLQQWMDAPGVEEIDVNSHLHTWVSYVDGRQVDVGQLWSSSTELVAFQKRIALRMGTGEGRLDTASPQLTLQSADGSRVVLVLGGPTEHGISTQPRIAIRRFVLPRLGIGALADAGMFPSDLVGFFEAVVRTGFTVLVSGGPGAGKTTFLVELCGLISPMERLITAEKALLELRLEDYPERHPNVVALHTRQANSEGVGEVAVRSIVELTRRLNPDRVIVGELVEDEALDMLDAASMCKRGSMATIHAHRPEIALTRLAYYVAKSNTKLPEYAVWNQIAGTIDFVVHIDLVRNQGTGRPMRRVTSIREIAGLGGAGGVASTELFGLDDSGQLVQRCAIEPGHARQMVLAGFDPTRFVPTSVNGARSWA